jgi:hypothetical protein
MTQSGPASIGTSASTPELGEPSHAAANNTTEKTLRAPESRRRNLNTFSIVRRSPDRVNSSDQSATDATPLLSTPAATGKDGSSD